jgi:ring-1,2-phenylacetyl-CoA epoxidase subunit PaaD
VKPALLQTARAALAQVVDPEIPVLTIDDLGVLRDVIIADDGVLEVRITPTYSGCPAMDVIAADISAALAQAGITNARIRTVLSPAWTTEWMSAAGRAKLREYGIAPPPCTADAATHRPACPQCGAGDTELLAEFASTSCKSLWRCRACREPFDLFKCH